MLHPLSFLKQPLRLGLLTALLASFFVFASPNDAQAGNFELHGGFGYLGVFNKGGDAHGISVTLSPGFRWDWIGVFLDQNLGGVFSSYDDFYGHRKYNNLFVGSTIINAKFFYNLGPAELWGQAGIGGAYVEKDGAFGLKLGIGLSVPLSSFLAIGGDFAYTLAAHRHYTNHFLTLSGHIRLSF